MRLELARFLMGWLEWEIANLLVLITQSKHLQLLWFSASSTSLSTDESSEHRNTPEDPINLYSLQLKSQSHSLDSNVCWLLPSSLRQSYLSLLWPIAYAVLHLLNFPLVPSYPTYPNIKNFLAFILLTFSSTNWKFVFLLLNFFTSSKHCPKIDQCCIYFPYLFPDIH